MSNLPSIYDLASFNRGVAPQPLSTTDLEQIAPTFHISQENLGQIGILFIHGFTGTPAVYKFLVPHFLDRGFSISCPLLAGHGTSSKDLEKTKWSDWLDTIVNSYQKLAKRCAAIAIVGHSLGGALAVNLAKSHPEIQLVTLIAPAIYPGFIHRCGRPISVLLNLFGVRFLKTDDVDIKSDSLEYRDIYYKSMPVKSVVDLLNCMESAQRALPKIDMRTLLMCGNDDHIVSKSSAKKIMKNLATKEKNLIFLPNSYHYPHLDNDKDTVIMCIEEQLSPIVKNISPGKHYLGV